jgi:TPR repeat protein
MMTKEVKKNMNLIDKVKNIMVMKTAEANKNYEAGRAAFYGLEGTQINLKTAYDSFKKAKELGKVEANLYLGMLYGFYGYPEINDEMTKAYYEECGNNPYAQIGLAFWYCNNGIDWAAEDAEEKAEEHYEKAKQMFQAVIEQGCVEGYLGKGYIAKLQKDYTTAFACFNKVLEGTEQYYITAAMSSIGEAYLYGYGVEEDNAKAMEWYEKAANLGHRFAMFQLGWQYEEGEIVEQDYAKALKWYEKSANLDWTMAMNNIGYMYQEGLGVEKDYAKALEWYERAANLEDESAMNNLGNIYQEGLGVEKDYAKALEWYEKAANLGDTSAMNNLGYTYQKGLGVEKDYAKALEWYEKAADLDDTMAMSNLGYMYQKGIGVEQDARIALTWYQKAASLGDTSALRNLLE